MCSVSDSFSVTLRREGPSQPWGFRLRGGVNFMTALSIQSVNDGSVAARAGLQAGDAVLQINGRPSDELKHEQARQEIITSGNNVFLVVQRGAVKIWKPKVTPMSENRPKEMNPRPNGNTVDEMYIQKTSLAASKPERRHFGSGFNRTAKPFGSSSLGAGCSGITIPAGRMPDLTASKVKTSVVGPSGAFLTVPRNDNKDAQKRRSASPNFLTTNVQRSCSPVFRNVSPTPIFQGNKDAQKRSASPNFLTNIQRSCSPVFRNVSPTLIFRGNKDAQKRSASPNFLTTNIQRSHSPVFRNVSPTPIFQGQGPDDSGSEINKTAMFNQVLHQMEIGKDTKEGEENLHQGTSNPGRQSRTFNLLEKELTRFEAEQGSSTDDSGTVQPIICTVKVSFYDPNQQGQQLTCKICQSLIAGVFVRIKGEALHPECFNCCRCGTNLKNQGYFHIEGQIYCEVHAKHAS